MDNSGSVLMPLLTRVRACRYHTTTLQRLLILLLLPCIFIVWNVCGMDTIIEESSGCEKPHHIGAPIRQPSNPFKVTTSYFFTQMDMHTTHSVCTTVWAAIATLCKLKDCVGMNAIEELS